MPPNAIARASRTNASTCGIFNSESSAANCDLTSAVCIEGPMLPHSNRTSNAGPALTSARNRPCCPGRE